MVAILYNETPKHKENFIKLANSKFYDNSFHRVIPVYDSGRDPESKSAGQSTVGKWRAGLQWLRLNSDPRLFHERGSNSDARTSDAVNPLPRHPAEASFTSYREKNIPPKNSINTSKTFATIRSQYPRNYHHRPVHRVAHTDSGTSACAGWCVAERVFWKEWHADLVKNQTINLLPSHWNKKNVYTTVGGTPFPG